MKIKKIGNILLKREIGSGAFGKVYAGIDTALNRKVSVKIIKEKFSKNKSIISFFKKEAVTQAQMNHPNIVSVYNFDKINSQYFIVFEYVEGRSLEEILKISLTLDLDIYVNYLKQILRGLHFAHTKNVIHFDIKPSNIMITNSNIVKITDFGIASLIGLNPLNKDEDRFGTPIYASPEQILGLSPDFRSDIYSLGIMSYKVLFGTFPYDFDYNGEHTKENILKDIDIEFPPTIPTKLITFYEKFLKKAMRKGVEMRYQTAFEMLEALDNIR